MLSRQDITALTWYISFAITVVICIGITYIYFISPTSYQKEQEIAAAQQQRITVAIPTQHASIDTPKKEEPIVNSGTKIQPPKESYINIIITDLGLSPVSSQYALQLPQEVTMSFSPHAIDLENWVEKATLTNHHILLSLPVESGPLSLTPTAPYTLSEALDPDRNIEQLKRILARTKKKLGIYAPSNTLLSSADTLPSVLETIKDEKLVWIHNNKTIKDETVKQLPQTLGITNFSPDGVIDQSLAPNNIRNALKELEQRSKQNGYAIAIARPYPITLRVLEEWFTTLGKKNITLTSLPSLQERLKNEQ